MKNFKNFLFIMFMITGATVFSKEEAPLYDDLTSDKISSFTSSLIGNREYYRAYVELRRLDSFYPSYINASVFDITSNYLFFKSEKYTELLEFDQTEISDEVFIPASIFRIDSLIKLDRKQDAEDELLRLYKRSDSGSFSEYLNKRSVYLSILNNKNKDVKLNADFLKYEELSVYSESIYEKKKNPYLGAFAGIVPGLGYFYAEESGTGIVSMIVIGLGSAVTYGSYTNGLDSLSLFSGAITFFFYGGSIAGGYMQTVKYNDRLMKTLEMRINRELMPERDLEEIYIKFGLNSNDYK